MLFSDPFRRAAALALAWCLIGLGIDPGPDAATVADPPAAGVPDRSAADRPATDDHPAPCSPVPDR